MMKEEKNQHPKEKKKIFTYFITEGKENFSSLSLGIKILKIKDRQSDSDNENIMIRLMDTYSIPKVDCA